MPDYLIKISIDSNTSRERIVRAKNRSQALAFAVADSIKVDVASIDDAVRITQAGGKVEQASE